jgi:4-amino-4-deoxy-L-arabinose transferase-like glycosyltransferase
VTQTQTDNPVPEPQSLSAVARVAWIALILATLYFCYFHNLGALGLVGPDEPRYAWIARDMAETGDWVTPKLYGKSWFEKPPLYYWGAALSFKLFGVSEATARLPSALAALLATLAMAWLAWRVYGAETARWLLLLLPTTVGMIGFSHAAATDMPFAAMLTIAMVFAAFVLGLVTDGNTPILPHTPWLTLLLFGFFLGLAALAKGPAAIVLAGGAVLLWAVFTKRWRDAFRCLHPAAIIAFGATALPWYILCARRNPDFFRVFIIEHNFERYLTPEFQHIQPFWFYLPMLLIALLPWTALFVPAAKGVSKAVRDASGQWQLTVLLLCWPLFTLLFFTASKSKLPGYILPALPPLVLLLAKFVASQITNRNEQRSWLLASVGGCFAVAGFVLPNRLPTYTDVRPSPEAQQIGLIIALAGMVVTILAVIRKNRLALFAIVIFSLLLVVKIDNFTGKLDRVLTARGALRETQGYWPDFSLEKASTWQLNRSLLYQLNFYAHKDLPEWKAGQPKPEWLFVQPNREAEARVMGFACRNYLSYRAVIPCKIRD